MSADELRKTMGNDRIEKLQTKLVSQLHNKTTSPYILNKKSGKITECKIQLKKQYVEIYGRISPLIVTKNTKNLMYIIKLRNKIIDRNMKTFRSKIYNILIHILEFIIVVFLIFLLR